MLRVISQKLYWDKVVGLHQIFLKNFRDKFEKSGLSQRAFARLVREDHTSVSRWLKGEREPSIDQVGLIAITLGCSISDLLSDQRDKNVASLTTETELRIRLERAIRLKIAAEIAAPADGQVVPRKSPKKS